MFLASMGVQEIAFSLVAWRAYNELIAKRLALIFGLVGFPRRRRASRQATSAPSASGTISTPASRKMASTASSFRPSCLGTMREGS